MEYTLTDIWKGQMCNAKLLKTMPGMLTLNMLVHGCVWMDTLKMGQKTSVKS